MNHSQLWEKCEEHFICNDYSSAFQFPSERHEASLCAEQQMECENILYNKKVEHPVINALETKNIYFTKNDIWNDSKKKKLVS